MKHVFILGYNRAEYFSNWIQKVKFDEDTKFYYIDNGQQEYTDDFLDSIRIHRTNKTVYCAGGWNLIAHYGFNLLKLDKLIIGQEDARFEQEIINAVWNNTTETHIQGTYANSFEFSLFGLHKNVYNTIGKFDENFLQAGCEDNDYKHRCKLKNITVSSLGISSAHNQSSTSEIRKNLGNEEYIHRKWGKAVNTDTRIYEYREPFNGDNVPMIRPDYITYSKLPLDTDKFMSTIEVERMNTLYNRRIQK